MATCEVCSKTFIPKSDETFCSDCKSNNNITRDIMAQPTEGTTLTDILLIDSAINTFRPTCHQTDSIPLNSTSVITEQPLGGDGVTVEHIEPDGCCECDDGCDCGDCECDGCCDCGDCDCGGCECDGCCDGCVIL